MNQPTSPLDLKQHIFRQLQRQERALWIDTMCTSIDEDDHLTAYHQREAFHLRRAEARRALRRTFDLTEEQLRTIEFEGILAGWPLESR